MTLTPAAERTQLSENAKYVFEMSPRSLSFFGEVHARSLIPSLYNHLSVCLSPSHSLSLFPSLSFSGFVITFPSPSLSFSLYDILPISLSL